MLAAHAVPAKPAAPEKPPAPVVEAALTEADAQLIARIDASIERAAQGDQEALQSLARAFGELDSLQHATATAAQRAQRAQPAPFDLPAAALAAQRAREAAARRDVNQKAVERGISAQPYPNGDAGMWAQEHYSSYETALRKAATEVQFRNQREPRPEGLFKKAAIAQWDAQTAALKNAATEWEKEIKWRDKAFKAASKAREAQDAAHIAKAKAAHELEHLPRSQNATLLLERSEAHTREHARLRAKAERLLSAEQQQAFERQERSHRHGFGR